MVCDPPPAHQPGNGLPWHLWRAVPWQQGIVVCYGRGVRQPFQYVAQPRIGLLAVDLGGLDQAIDLRAFRGTAYEKYSQILVAYRMLEDA